MKFFINSGICARKGTYKVSFSKEKQLVLCIPNYMEYEKKHESINFIFSDADANSKSKVKDNMLLTDISLRKCGKNTYYIEPSKGHDDNSVIYALIRNASIAVDDIFIPACMKDKVEVLERIRYVDEEADYGQYLSNVYLIKIKLDTQESLPIYFSSEHTTVLSEHNVIYNPSYEQGYKVYLNLQTYILLNNSNRDEYISLSNLCN